MTRTPASEALKRFTVLDLTRARAGPTAARMLADWGADVIKIEAPLSTGARDPMAENRHDPDFTNLHRNKRNIAIDLKKPAGVAIFKRLASTADVVLENYRPAVKERLGIAYEDLRPLNPRLVYGSISGFGQDGPYRDRPGVDQIAQGMGGLMSITGLPGQGPVRVGIPISDLCAGILLAYGVLAALHEREVSGEGQWVNTSLLESMIHMLDFQAARWLIAEDIPEQAGNDHPTHAPMGVFTAADGDLNIGVTGRQIWERFCTAIDASELVDDPRYRTSHERWQQREVLRDAINAKLAGNAVAHWVTVLNAAGVPSGPINRVDQVFADPQVRHLGIAQKPANGDPVTLVGQAIRMSRTPSHVQSAPRQHGQDTDTILEAAGYSPDDIAGLRAEKVI
ncbi:MAG: CaiB/BaiF CoA-transferase family protein [Proteobacteria bacterium]|nr:CaiB/BaiF CoA-transferase family protein [Pseudomonadota bacterium]MDA1059879.1 CaiB/BaiF CoA-transferase family protein [Pseudomonadota bacterium]